MLSYKTAGESHGRYLSGILSGFPSGFKLTSEMISKELIKRQKGYGRSERMKVEEEIVEIIGGVVNGYTTGAPISLLIENKGILPMEEIYIPRPGHGDLTGMIKYDLPGGRAVLERTSARETAMRVALSAICKLFLKQFNIEIKSHVVSIGSVFSDLNYYNGLEYEDFDSIDLSEVRSLDKNAEAKMIDLIKKASEDGDSLGGQVELLVYNYPMGLGSCMDRNKTLDSKLAAEIISLQGIKGVFFGRNIFSEGISGYNYHDSISYLDRYKRDSNNCGGIEAGMSNGETLVMRAAMKAIPTLKRALKTIDIRDKKESLAFKERADICAVPAAAVILENIISVVLLDEFLNKFGSDSLNEIKRNYESWIEYLRSR